MKAPGIYCIRNKMNGNIYIGGSINMQRRWYEHRSQLRRNKHPNPHLQNSWNKRGEDAYEFIPLMICPNEWITKIEQLMLDELVPHYNVGNNAKAPRRGIRLTKKQRQILSEAHMGISNGPHGEDHKRKIGDSNRGKVRSREFCRFLSESQVGKPKPQIRGERNGQSKLTEKIILEIRKRYKDGETQSEIAKDYEVNAPYISMIVNRKRWGWLE